MGESKGSPISMGEHTLHLTKRPTEFTDSQIDVDLRIHGRRFMFRFDIPDSKGTVPVTDIDRQHMLDRIMRALDGKFGKIRLRAEL